MISTSRALLLLALTVPLLGCGKANATELTPENPLACVLVFEAYHQTAEQLGKSSFAKGFDARASQYAAEARLLPPEQRTDEQVKRMSQEFIALKDGGEALALECMKRQNAKLGMKG